MQWCQQMQRRRRRRRVAAARSSTSSCTADADCTANEANTICRQAGYNARYCAYLGGSSTSDSSLCLSSELNTSGECNQSAITNGGECYENSHCVSNICDTTTNLCDYSGYGGSCYEDFDCLSNSCTSNLCNASDQWDTCRTTEDCLLGLSCDETTFQCLLAP